MEGREADPCSTWKPGFEVGALLSYSQGDLGLNKSCNLSDHIKNKNNNGGCQD